MEYNPNRFRDVMQFSRMYFPPKGRQDTKGPGPGISLEMLMEVLK
jgi:hypothetical protein